MERTIPAKPPVLSQRQMLSKFLLDSVQGSRKALVFLLLAGLTPPGFATNRCITPSGQILYTDASCESLGAKHEREVKAEISVVAPSASSPSNGKPNSPATKETKPARKAFQKSPKSPVLTICYDSTDARKDVSKGDVEAAISNAVSLWNAGCNVSYQFLGTCATDIARSDRPIDYKVWWASWDNTMLGKGNGDALSTARDHAIAAASPRIGVSLNRDIEGFTRQYRRAIVHEFGHVVGVGHSPNRDDIMYSGGKNATPTENDLEACNKAVEARFGVKSAGN